MKIIIGLWALFIASIELGMAVPITGNPNGTVTLIEYYDYECPHCRRMEPLLVKLENHFSELRIVHRDVPLLAPQSVPIGALALSTSLQGQWLLLHQALMDDSAAPNVNDVEMIAKQLGISFSKLISKAQKPIIHEQLQQNIYLVKKYSLQGKIVLPIFVFGRTDGMGQKIVIRGERPYPLLAAVVGQLEGNNNVQDKKTKKQ